MQEYFETDVLILGAGIAGATTALVLAENGINTTIIAKGKDETETNTYWAQGGIAALAEDEPPQDFIEDIMKSGCNINNPEAVEQVVTLSRQLVKKILLEKIISITF